MDISSDDQIDEKEVRETQRYLLEHCLMNSISIHIIPTGSVDFSSVKNMINIRNQRAKYEKIIG